MSRRPNGWSGGTKLGAMLVAYALSGPACGPNVGAAVHTEFAGGSDDQPRYGANPPLGNPPTLDSTAPAADYLIGLSTLIQPAWATFLEDCRLRLPSDHPLNNASLIAELVLTIDGSGALLAVDVAKSSGNTEFDEVAKEIAGDLQGGKEPPAEWISVDDRVHVGWKFARDIRQASSIGASIRRVDLPIAEALKSLLDAGKISRAAERIIDAGGRSIPQQQVDEILHRALQLALNDDDPRVAASALRVIADSALLGFKDEARRALDSSDDELALEAARALGRTGDESDIKRLEELARGERPASAEICAAAGESLSILGQEPQTKMAAIEGLSSAEEATRLAALAVLSQLEADDAVRPLSKILKGNSNASRVERSLAAAALGRQAVKVVAAQRALLASTRSPDAAIRTSCLNALASAAEAGLRSRAAFRKVMALVKNKDERVRAAAIHAAAKLAPLRFARELKTVRAGGSKLVVLSIARVLGELPGDVALSRLLDLASAPSPEMRKEAALGLARRDENQAEIALQTLLGDESAPVRVAAMTNLQHEPRLKILLRDSSSQVQVAALTTLIIALGKAKTSKMIATLLAASESDRALQVQLAQAWHLLPQ